MHTKYIPWPTNDWAGALLLLALRQPHRCSDFVQLRPQPETMRPEIVTMPFAGGAEAGFVSCCPPSELIYVLVLLRSQGKKPKLGLKESFRVLGKSKYLAFLATLVLGYGLCIAMTEGAA